MSLIGPGSPTIQTRVEVAFDADLTAPAESWDWTELGDYIDAGRTRPRVVRQDVQVTSGVTGDNDEALVSNPNAVDLLLGNGDGALTPMNPESPYWPGLRRPTPLRVSVKAGAPHLLLKGVTGSRARTPDVAALDITGDLAFAMELLSPVQTPPAGVSCELAAKYSTTGNQRSWLIGLTAAGELFLSWSTNGSTVTNKISTLALPCPEAGIYTIGGEFDVDNGAGGNTMTWYAIRGTVDDLRADLTGSLLGEPEIDSGTTSIFSSTAPLDVGDVGGNTTAAAYPGRLNRFQLRSGDLTSGTVVADLDCTALSPGDTGVTDSAGRVWSFSDAEITDWRPRACVRVVRSEPTWDVVDEANPLMPTVAHLGVGAEGILQRLAQADPLQSALRRRITAPHSNTTVHAYWPLEDGRDATSIFNQGGSAGGVMAMDLASDATLASSDALPSVSGGSPFGWNLQCPPSAPVATWEYTMLVNIPTAPDAGAGEFIDLQRIDCASGVTSQWVLRIDDTDWRVFAKDLDGVNVLSASGASDARMFGTWMIVTLSVGLSGSNITWDLDLTPIPLGLVFGGSGTLASLGLPAGSPVGLRTLSSSAPQEGFSVGHFIVTTGAVTGWLARADTAYVGEPAPERVFRLCSENGIPVAVHGPYGLSSWPAAVAAGAQAMGPQRPAKILDLLTECAAADFGILTEQRGALGLAYRSGATLTNQPVRLSLSRADRQVDDPFRPVDDDQRFANDVTVSRTEGSSYHIVDPKIEAGTEERYPTGPEVNVASDGQLGSQTGWRYHLGTWRELRYPEVRTDGSRAGASVEDLLGFAAGDRVQVTDPPPGVMGPVDQLAHGITEDITTFQWKLGFNGRPAGPWEVGVRDDDDRAKRDNTATVLDAEFVAGTDTTMDVDVTTGLPWTTAAAEYPFDLEVAGARVTATACGAPSGSVQTFTVSTTVVNGVAKTVPAGTPVRLWRPTVRAL